MRGTGNPYFLQQTRRRITPACAGNSGRIRSKPAWTRDHPRVCGEQSVRSRALNASKGSPPRVRGTVCDPVLLDLLRGITPACAGNRRAHVSPECALEDHPRVCGEQRQPRTLKRLNEGSPPRVRGTGIISAYQDKSRRITPACAGNRASYLSFPRSPEDHPRVCGEQTARYLHENSFEGSPPRVRGTDEKLRLFSQLRRITPACAGNSPPVVFLIGFLTSNNPEVHRLIRRATHCYPPHPP